MAKKISGLVGKIHQGDCVEGLKNIPAGSVDLAFADPPFNIGFKYDQYKDRLKDDQYLEWSRQWMAQVHRALKPNGTFWLAIGDEYAAELKVEAQKIGFHCRSWVIWYYTFGVNCKKKFTRSHAHLFHFVKDKQDFVFNHEDMDLRVPSARRLIYNDSRASSKGRMPDDTWILRPQELVDGFNPDEDTWHFPRVAGTFKERAGFHGCQMPEQLLGRIIRACSQENDIVIDPFSGSSTTVAVAKKLGRRFCAFELSKDYVRLGRKRLQRIVAGDPLDGSPEPSMKNLMAKEEKGNNDPNSKEQMSLLPNEQTIHDELACELDGIIEAFGNSSRGYSTDRLIADPILNEDFQMHCDRLSIPGSCAERNRFLFRARKAGKFNTYNVQTKLRTNIDWKQISTYIYASEIAWRQIANKYCMSLEEIFCDPRIAAQFDDLASKFAPGFQPLDYRWAAMKLRKEGSYARKRAALRAPKDFGIAQMNHGLKKQKGILVSDLKINSIDSGPGVYLIREPDGKALYAGETNQLAARLTRTFDESGPRSQWLQRSEALEIFYQPVESIADYPFARQSWLLKWHRPQWNSVRELSA